LHRPPAGQIQVHPDGALHRKRRGTRDAELVAGVSAEYILRQIAPALFTSARPGVICLIASTIWLAEKTFAASSEISSPDGRYGMLICFNTPMGIGAAMCKRFALAA
jgi:hypothetical protein